MSFDLLPFFFWVWMKLNGPDDEKIIHHNLTKFQSNFVAMEWNAGTSGPLSTIQCANSNLFSFPHQGIPFHKRVGTKREVKRAAKENIYEKKIDVSEISAAQRFNESRENKRKTAFSQAELWRMKRNSLIHAWNNVFCFRSERRFPSAGARIQCALAKGCWGRLRDGWWWRFSHWCSFK